MDMASLLAAYFSDIGGELEIKALEPGIQWTTIHEGRHEMMAFLGMGSAPIDSAKVALTTTSFNPSRWAPSVYEEKLKDTLQEMNLEKLAEKIKELNIMHALGFHMLQPIVAYGYIAWWPWVKHYWGEMDTGYQNIGPIVARLWIDQELKKEMGY